MDPIAVVKIDDIYRVAIKHTDTFNFEGEVETNINWEVYKISSTGIIDYSALIWTESITSWEDEFDLDLNGDGDKSGQITLTPRNTDTTGATLASEGANGALYIVDGDTQIAINDSWIESSSNWGDGSHSSTAIAVSDKNNNGTDDNTADDYYQVAVKMSNTWTDFSTGQKIQTKIGRYILFMHLAVMREIITGRKLFGHNLSRVMRKLLDRILMVMMQ